jgi:hypothetical protein
MPASRVRTPAGLDRKIGLTIFGDTEPKPGGEAAKDAAHAAEIARLRAENAGLRQQLSQGATKRGGAGLAARDRYAEGAARAGQSSSWVKGGGRGRFARRRFPPDSGGIADTPQLRPEADNPRAEDRGSIRSPHQPERAKMEELQYRVPWRFSG